MLQNQPFTDQVNIVELFSADLGMWNGIRRAIERVNTNAAAAIMGQTVTQVNFSNHIDK